MNLNKVQLIGRLGKKPEVNYIKEDVPVAKFSLATSEQYKTRDGEKREVTEWHNIVAWRNTAKFCENYLDKGLLVYVEGKLQTRKWDGQDGVTKYSTEIVVDQIKILEKKNTPSGQGYGNAPNPAPAQNNVEQKPVEQKPVEQKPFDNVSPELNGDDDLPF